MSYRGFASDNQSGAHPDVLAALARANVDHVHAYGDDEFTAEAVEVMRGHLGAEAEVFFVFSGTGANVVGLSTALTPWHAVVCTDAAHIATDEAGAPERFTGSKLITVGTPDGRLTPELAAPAMRDARDEHQVKPAVLSLTQLTELGTLYTPDDVRALADAAHANGLLVHMDGARIANAAVALGAPFREFTTDAGVDILSFGGTKNGLLFGEAVCFLSDAGREGARDFKWVRKQGMQLASKGRFIAAQFTAMYGTDLWHECAGNANARAAELAEAAAAIPGVRITQDVAANEVFAQLPREWIAPLQERWHFYTWDEPHDEVRWVTSWDTTAEDVAGFVSAIRELEAG
jgi:threonine aldolase